MEQVDLVSLISEYSPLKRTGKNHMGLCPFHGEKTASFSVSEEKQLYHCFGCHVSGDAINFIMEKENLDFIDAIEYLADKFGIDLTPYRMDHGKEAAADVRKHLYQVNRDAAIFYYKNLMKSENAIQYLRERGMNETVVKAFGLGFAPDAWDLLLKEVGKSAQIVKFMNQAGLLTERKENSGFYDRFRNRLMFPIRDVKGNILGFGGRVLDDSLPKYLNSPETILFNKSVTLYGLYNGKKAIKEANRVVVVEGYMDVIALHQFGVEIAVATLGTALTHEHGKILERYAKEIILCFDGDDAGKRAALRSLEVLKDTKSKLRILTLKDRLDPDEFIRRYGREAFLKALDDALDCNAFKLDVMKLEFNLNTQRGKHDYLKKAAGFIKAMSNEIEKRYYVDWLAADMGFDRFVIIKEVEGEKAVFNEQHKQHNQSFQKNQSKRSNYQEAPIIEKVSIDLSGRNALMDLERKLLELSLQDRQIFQTIAASVDVDAFRNEDIKELMQLLTVYYMKNGHLDLKLIGEAYGLETAIRFERYMIAMVASSQIQKDLQTTINTYHLHSIDEKIEMIRSEKQLFEQNEAHSMAPEEVSKMKLMYIRKEQELKKMKSEAMTGKLISRGGQSNG